MLLTETAEAIEAVRKTLKDPELIRACEETVKDLLYLSYKIGDQFPGGEERVVSEVPPVEKEKPVTVPVSEKQGSIPEPFVPDVPDAPETASDDSLFNALFKGENIPSEEPEEPAEEASEEPVPEKEEVLKEEPPKKAPGKKAEPLPSDQETESLMDELLRMTQIPEKEEEKPKKETAPVQAETEEKKEDVPARPKEPDFVPEKKILFKDCQFTQVQMTASTGSKHQEFVLTVYPLTAEANEGNAPIFAAMSTQGEEPVFASSYETPGKNMLMMKVGKYHFFIQGAVTNHKFTVQVALGKDSPKESKLTITDKRSNDPDPSRIKNGHIKFSYNAGGDVIGIIEVFPLGRSFVYVHKVQEFIDMRLLGHNDLVIQDDTHEMKRLYCHREDVDGRLTGNSVLSADLGPISGR